jgi:hypothetical protein
MMTACALLPNHELLALLRKVEWLRQVRYDAGHADYGVNQCCPSCGGCQPGESFAPTHSIGHRSGCALQSALSALEQGQAEGRCDE